MRLLTIALTILFMLTGLFLGACTQSEAWRYQNWIEDQQDRCRAQGGVGVLLRYIKTVECWQRSRYLASKLEDQNTKTILLYSIKYGE